MFIIIFIGCDTGILLLLGVGAGAVEEVLVLVCGEDTLLLLLGAGAGAGAVEEVLVLGCGEDILLLLSGAGEEVLVSRGGTVGAVLVLGVAVV